MAERTNFVGKLIYSAILGAIIYPIVVFWTWGGGWIAAQGFTDFAGSTIVHMTGGIVALVGAYMVGPRAGRVFGRPPAASNLGIAALGTFYPLVRLVWLQCRFDAGRQATRIPWAWSL